MALSKKALAAAAFGAALAIAGSAHADFSGPVNFPPFGSDTQPGLIITLNPGGTGTLTSTGQPPYDNIEDTYIGVVNNSGHSVGSLSLTGASGSGIFGFDGDGINTFGAPGNGTDTTGYGGPDAFFTNFVLGGDTGTVNFIGGIGNGNWDYFSLEGPLTAASFTVSIAPGPVPGAGFAGLFALALGAAALKLRERFAR